MIPTPMILTRATISVCSNSRSDVAPVAEATTGLTVPLLIPERKLAAVILVGFNTRVRFVPSFVVVVIVAVEMTVSLLMESLSVGSILFVTVLRLVKMVNTVREKYVSSLIRHVSLGFFRRKMIPAAHQPLRLLPRIRILAACFVAVLRRAPFWVICLIFLDLPPHRHLFLRLTRPLPSHG